MHLHHTQERFMIGFVLVERANRLGQFAAGQIGRTVHDRSDRTTNATAFIRVIRHTVRHQQTAQVGIAKS